MKEYGHALVTDVATDIPTGKIVLFFKEKMTI